MRKSLIFNSLLLILVLVIPAYSQVEPAVPMADGLRSEGKIYVVVISVLLILTGIFAFLFWLENRIGKLENRDSK